MKELPRIEVDKDDEIGYQMDVQMELERLEEEQANG